nr:hypothetical protein B0A51_15999 [Rachicladosporium sp. CCFEE 5018]
MAFTLPYHQKQRFVGSAKGPDQHSRTYVKYAKARSGKTAMMLCGIHPHPAKIPALPDRSSKNRDSRYYRPWNQGIYKRALGPGEYRGSCICAYYSYPILLESIENSDPNTPFRLPFLELPAELRDIVLEKIFKLDRTLDFCPIPLRDARRPA